MDTQDWFDLFKNNQDRQNPEDSEQTLRQALPPDSELLYFRYIDPYQMGPATRLEHFIGLRHNLQHVFFHAVQTWLEDGESEFKLTVASNCEKLTLDRLIISRQRTVDAYVALSDELQEPSSVIFEPLVVEA